MAENFRSEGRSSEGASELNPRNFLRNFINKTSVVWFHIGRSVLLMVIINILVVLNI